MDKKVENTQQLFVSCVVPETGTPYVEILVFGQEKDLQHTYVVLLDGDNPIESRQVEIQKTKCQDLSAKEVGFVRMLVDRTHVRSTLTAYSVIKSLDSEDSGVKSRTITFRM